MNAIAKFLQAAKMMASQGARFDDVVSAFRETFNRTPKGMEVIGIRKAFRDAAEGEKVIPFPQKRSFKEEIESMEMKPVTEEEVIAKYKQMNEETVKKMREKKGMPPKEEKASGGLAGLLGV